MSLYDYRRSIEIAAQDEPFYALIMAAMRQADTDNLNRLQALWPHLWTELNRRVRENYGILPEERGS